MEKAVQKLDIFIYFLRGSSMIRYDDVRQNAVFTICHLGSPRELSQFHVWTSNMNGFYCYKEEFMRQAETLSKACGSNKWDGLFESNFLLLLFPFQVIIFMLVCLMLSLKSIIQKWKYTVLRILPFCLAYILELFLIFACIYLLSFHSPLNTLNFFLFLEQQIYQLFLWT